MASMERDYRLPGEKSKRTNDSSVATANRIKMNLDQDNKMRFNSDRRMHTIGNSPDG